LVLTSVAWRRPEPERAHLFEASQTAQTDQKRKEDIEKMGKQIQGTLADLIREKSREEGKVLGYRQGLRQLLEDRFGSIPEDLIQKIEACEDAERLLAAMRQVLRVQSPEEIAL
jgi:hypothetical protein